MEAISAREAARVKVNIQVAKYTHIVPARPPLVRENRLPNSIPIHVDIVVTASPSTDNDLKFLRSSCDRPIRLMSQASDSVPVARPVTSAWTCPSRSAVGLLAGVGLSAVSWKPLLGCIS